MRKFLHGLFYIPLLCMLLISTIPKINAENKNRQTFLVCHSIGDFGMFGTLCFILGVLKMYDESSYSGLKIDFQTHGLYYDPLYGPNWIQYYFEPLNFGSEKGADIRVLEINELGHGLNSILFRTSREHAHYLVKKYLKLRPNIQEKINEFQKNRFEKFMIGVHYRGTDKSTEAPRVPFENVTMEILQIIESLPFNYPYKIFVASDEQAFIDYMLQQFPDKIVYVETNIHSITGVPIHYDPQYSGYKKGEDGLLDCYLLAKCNFLIRTSSGLSLLSSFINPDIPVVRLNKSMYDP
jgi:Alpha-(1,6)-fucosyltransferase N- and catalytic domains